MDVDKNAPITQTGLADHFGLSKSYITKLKKQGCPVDTIAAFEIWRQERQMASGTRTKPPDMGEIPAPGAPPRPPSLEEEPDDVYEAESPSTAGVSVSGLLQVLENARRTEREAHRMVRHAQRYKLDSLLGQRLANHAKASEQCTRMERSIREERERRGELITGAQHKIQLNKLWIPLVTQMRKLPRVLAMKVNPSDDVFAEKLISEAVEEVIAEGRRSLETPPDVDLHLKVWLLSVLNEKDTNYALEKLDELRGKLLGTVVLQVPDPVFAPVEAGGLGDPRDLGPELDPIERREDETGEPSVDEKDPAGGPESGQ